MSIPPIPKIQIQDNRIPEQDQKQNMFTMKTIALSAFLLLGISSLTVSAETMNPSNLRRALNTVIAVGEVTRPPNRPPVVTVGEVTRPPKDTGRAGPLPDGTFQIKTNITLTYFSGMPSDVDRDLTDAEYKVLQNLIGEFYTNAFKADFAKDLQLFQSTFSQPRIYTPGAVVGVGKPSLVIPFDSTLTFNSGSGMNVNVLLQQMVNAEYQSFITYYLFRDQANLGPGNQLHRVQHVEFDGMSVP